MRIVSDTPLGVLVWAAGAEEGEALVAPLSGRADSCFDLVHRNATSNHTADSTGVSVRDKLGQRCLVTHANTFPFRFGDVFEGEELLRFLLREVEQVPSGWQERVRNGSFVRTEAEAGGPGAEEAAAAAAAAVAGGAAPDVIMPCGRGPPLLPRVAGGDWSFEGLREEARRGDAEARALLEDCLVFGPVGGDGD